jgi:hypothetical protein
MEPKVSSFYLSNTTRAETLLTKGNSFVVAFGKILVGRNMENL